MNLLILTVTAGHGHNQTAKAISDYAESHGHNAPVLDAIEYINPLLKEWQNMNRDALVYWRELGLTPAGLKKLNDDSMKPAEQSPLDKVLANLEKGSEPKTPKKTVKKTVAKTKSKAKPKTTKAGKK